MAERRSEISGLMRLPAAAPRAHRSALVAWMALLLAAVIYPAWWPVFLHLVPNAVDPTVERLALIGMCVLFLTIAAVPRYRHHVVRLSHIALYITTFHFFSLLWRNQLAAPYVAATFVFLAAVTLSFVTLRLLIAYSLCVVALAVTVAIAVPSAHDQESVLLVAGVVTAACMMTALSWRNFTLQRAARRKVSDARDFLRGVISAIPDPVFVLDHRLRCLLVNDAMSEVRGAPTPDGEASLAPLLEGLMDELPAALDADRPIEKEITLQREGEPPGTALAKLSAGQLDTGSRYLIGVIRDITERKALEQSLENKIHELEQARLKVNQLQGLLPICMHCGRIRGEGEWQDLERYIESHSGAVFSHGLCNSCLATHYP